MGQTILDFFPKDIRLDSEKSTNGFALPLSDSLPLCFLQEALLSIVGAALLILVGVITLDSYDHPQLGSPAGKALGGLCITAGGLFAVNLLLVFKAIREERETKAREITAVAHKLLGILYENCFLSCEVAQLQGGLWGGLSVIRCGTVVNTCQLLYIYNC